MQQYEAHIRTYQEVELGTPHVDADLAENREEQWHTGLDSQPQSRLPHEVFAVQPPAFPKALPPSTPARKLVGTRVISMRLV